MQMTIVWYKIGHLTNTEDNENNRWEQQEMQSYKEQGHAHMNDWL